MTYWEIHLLDKPVWNGTEFTYSGVPSVSHRVQFGNSPIRDRKSRNEFIQQLAQANANFTVQRIET